MGETKGRLRREIADAYKGRAVTPNDSDWLIADAIDRIAEDVAAVKAMVGDIEPDDVRHFVESEKAWVSLVEQQRYKALDEAARLRARVAELEARVVKLPKLSAGMLRGYEAGFAMMLWIARERLDAAGVKWEEE